MKKNKIGNLERLAEGIVEESFIASRFLLGTSIALISPAPIMGALATFLECLACPSLIDKSACLWVTNSIVMAAAYEAAETEKARYGLAILGLSLIPEIKASIQYESIAPLLIGGVTKTIQYYWGSGGSR